jgi:hypothetical protein
MHENNRLPHSNSDRNSPALALSDERLMAADNSVDANDVSC